MRSGSRRDKHDHWRWSAQIPEKPNDWQINHPCWCRCLKVLLVFSLPVVCIIKIRNQVILTTLPYFHPTKVLLLSVPKSVSDQSIFHQLVLQPTPGQHLLSWATLLTTHLVYLPPFLTCSHQFFIEHMSSVSRVIPPSAFINLQCLPVTVRLKTKLEGPAGSGSLLTSPVTADKTCFRVNNFQTQKPHFCPLTSLPASWELPFI